MNHQLENYRLEMDDDGILHTVFISNLQPKDLRIFQETAEDFLREAKEEGRPLHILVDARQVGRVDPKARKTIVDLDRQNPDGKVAILGFARYLKVFVMLMTKATGRDNIRFFDSEDEAMTWLKVVD